MHLIQILLPLYDNAGKRLPQDLYVRVREQLLERFDGLTVYTRAPADGFWVDAEKQPVHDDVIVYEVMTEDIQKEWWHNYRTLLEKLFDQQTLIIRAHPILLL